MSTSEEAPLEFFGDGDCVIVRNKQSGVEMKIAAEGADLVATTQFGNLIPHHERHTCAYKATTK